MSAKKDQLKEYRARRDFTKTEEPSGSLTPKTKQPLFVIQKHAASHLHYDFRLEIDGVLASWAVPKGISENPADKRLAVRTEDHPLAYASFEGRIPAGEYGAGTVEIWDKGTFENSKKKDGELVPLDECLQRGQLEIILHGKKAKGAFALVRMQRMGKENWLLIKMKESKATNAIAKKDKQILDDDPPSSSSSTIKSNGHTIALTNQDTILFPDDGFTKGDLIAYYQRIAPYMLPLMKDRLITMNRFPNGIGEEGFYQKDAADYFPQWIKQKAVKKQDDGSVHYIVGNDAATLIYMANLACITPHLWLSRADKLRYPDRMIFDLDPSKENDFTNIMKTALTLKKLLEDSGLHPFVMTTGSRGLHIVTPLDRSASFDTVRACAKAIAEQLVKNDPAHLTLEMRKEKRHGRIFIDYLRNSYGATGVAPYAVRARPGAPVATPIAWDEVKTGLRPDKWNIKNIFKRLASIDNPWKDINKYKGNIKKACKKMKA